MATIFSKKDSDFYLSEDGDTYKVIREWES